MNLERLVEDNLRRKMKDGLGTGVRGNGHFEQMDNLK